MCGSYGRCRMLKRKKNPDCNLESECLPQWWHWRLWAERWLELRRSYTALCGGSCKPRMTFRVLDNRTRKMAYADTVCQRLMSVPGVGFITALTFKAGVDDPHRFKRSRAVGAHFGLTPRRFQSGEIDIEGHISKCGDADVRATLYTAANALLTRSARWSSLKAWGMKLAKSRGHRRAVIAVARKLAVILHRVWIDDTQFRWGTEGARS